MAKLTLHKSLCQGFLLLNNSHSRHSSVDSKAPRRSASSLHSGVLGLWGRGGLLHRPLQSLGPRRRQVALASVDFVGRHPLALLLRVLHHVLPPQRLVERGWCFLRLVLLLALLLLMLPCCIALLWSVSGRLDRLGRLSDVAFDARLRLRLFDCHGGYAGSDLVDGRFLACGDRRQRQRPWWWHR